MAEYPSLTGYLFRVVTALAVLSLCAFFLTRNARRGARGKRGNAAVGLLASLPLGKDVLFVVRCGPDVLAFTLGGSGACLMGRWKHEEWRTAQDSESG